MGEGCRDQSGQFVPTPWCTGKGKKKSTKPKRCRYGVVKKGTRKGKCKKRK